MGRWSSDPMIVREKKKSRKQGEKDLKDLAGVLLLPAAPVVLGANLLLGGKKKKKKKKKRGLFF